MSHKIYDIIPPPSPAKKRVEEKVEREVKKVEVGKKMPRKKPERVQRVEFRQEIPKIVERVAQTEKKKGKKPNFRYVLFTLSVSFLILIIFFYKTLQKAEVVVWPKQELIEDKVKVDLSQEIKETNIFERKMSAVYLSEEKELIEEFKATGSVTQETKAEGTIQIYNNYSTSSQPLVATTRFVSDSGKLFRLKKKVTVPGAKMEKGKLIPAFIEAEVIADRAGPEYNIGPSTFSIPGFAGTPKFTGFYGKSLQAMKGGGKGKGVKVTKEDISKAEKLLTKKALEAVKNSLKNRIEQDYFVSDEIISEKVLDSSSSVKENTRVDSFNFKVRAMAEVVTVKRSDLDKFVKESILFKKAKEKKVINEKSLKINFLPQRIDVSQKKAEFNLDFNVKIFLELDENLLKESLKGKSSKEVVYFFKTKPEVERYTLKLSPFWTRKIPENKNKIKLEIKID